MPSNDFGYFSHFPILAAMMERSRLMGPVLELGMGWGSTPLLSAMCKVSGRPLESYETDPKWADLYRFFEHENHTIRTVEKWEDAPFWMTEKHYGLVFIDCAPGDARRWIASRLAKRADFILLHDSLSDGIHGSGGDYRYEEIIPQFRFAEHYAVLRPATLVLSNSYAPMLGKEEQMKRVVL